MQHGRVIFVVGDVHGDFNALNKFINRRIRQARELGAVAARWRADGHDFGVLVLQCGDMAYFWPQMDSGGAIRNEADFLPGRRVPIYWVGGNHEDWDRLDSLGSGIVEIDRAIYYCPFGSTLPITPDLTVLFAGGAESADKDWRLSEMARGVPRIWWPQEGISHADMARLEAVPRADWVVSHTAPASFDVEAFMRGDDWHFNEPSRLKLEQVLVKYSPRRWFFGHFHRPMHGLTGGCDWECLAALGSSGRAWEKIYMEWED